MTKYPKLKDYEGFEIDPEKEIIRFACCDCGLVHSMGIALEKDGKLGVSFRRETRATAQLRRHLFGNLQKFSVGKWSMKRD